MLQMAKRTIKRLFFTEKREIPICWVRHSQTYWLTQQFAEDIIKPKKSPYSQKIEQIASETNSLGRQPLWDGYLTNDPANDRGSTRMPNNVRTASVMGDFYTSLVTKRRPNLIVEFGTAFGVSGMYFLAGLEANQEGELLTFEPNKIWADIARKNLNQISNRFNLTIGTFEENIDQLLLNSKTIDVAFIDAIHTSEFVIPQLNIVIERSSPQAIIIIDDINFSEDMKNCWEEVSADSRFAASAKLGNRVGILELKS
ncbi:O-methyltransferase [Limnofasciculus baicalensis]|uniref:Class I SAM-dependent methyltransferase n=1 Tax=Limnofasciculus baicalensis BBK-W-15 TaxID=2699891 RepID=A0AAE3GTR6_9CYAN|nr:class I SAM-dependent methyltransferase [Limnofasciculus baicalensis]MCP2729728.1 class I SAM-dependent methyltransferase [Limnofasciculus baicalensis BBK-W-15]